jgi:protein transport protein SEC13
MESSSQMSSSATASRHKSFDTHHEDLIHDIQPDFFGKRIATASSDRTVRIFDEDNRLLATLSGGQ